MNPPRDSKGRALGKHGTLHTRPEQVRDPLFQHSEFFDPRDLVLVKYEMLRRVRIEGMGVTADMIPDLAVHCMTDACHFTNPKLPTVEEYEAMFREAMG